MTILCSPTEPASLRALGITSPAPELHGADFLLPTAGGAHLFAIQRKTVPNDLVASLEDGRLARGVAALQHVSGGAAILLEGRPETTPDGFLLGTRLSLKMLHGLILSIQLVAGLSVLWSRDTADSAILIIDTAAWLTKLDHGSILRRPGPISPWRIQSKDLVARHFLEGVPGIGPALADRLLARFSGIPIRWTCSAEDLANITGIGPKRATAILSALPLVTKDTEQLAFDWKQPPCKPSG